VSLETPLRLGGPDIAWHSTLSHLSPGAEGILRGMLAVGGGPIRDHFPAFAGTRWHLWPLTAAQRDMLATRPSPQTITTETKFERAVGVHPEIVRTYRS